MANAQPLYNDVIIIMDQWNSDCTMYSQSPIKLLRSYTDFPAFLYRLPNHFTKFGTRLVSRENALESQGLGTSRNFKSLKNITLLWTISIIYHSLVEWFNLLYILRTHVSCLFIVFSNFYWIFLVLYFSRAGEFRFDLQFPTCDMVLTHINALTHCDFRVCRTFIKQNRTLKVNNSFTSVFFTPNFTHCRG